MKLIQEAIKVMVRIRPPSDCMVYRDEKNPNFLHCGDKGHILDHIFTAMDKNQDIFQKVGYDLVSNTLQGYNSTLFVYGHTGSGKTFTMNGSNNQQGLICKTLKLLLKMTQNSAKYEYFSLKMSYFQIYNQQVKDLLGTNKLTVRQKVQKGFYIQGLQEMPLESIDEFQKIYRKGMHNRKTDTTKMNADSSRSHAILTFYVETKQKINGSIVCPTSKLNFVDLAGAERLRQTQAIGDRKSEAAKINTSLSILKRVINMLSTNKNKDMVGIPYRESVLTMILKDSLGGNSHTIIIGTIFNNIKNSSNTNDMLATLEFLERAKKVKNEKKVNQKLQGNQERLQYKISQYQKQIESYKKQIEELKDKLLEANKSKQVYQQQIKELKEKLILNQSPNFQFLETTQNQFDNPFQNCNSFKEGLSVIDEEQNLSFKSIKCPNQPTSNQCTQQSQVQSIKQFPQEYEKTNRKSHRSQSHSQKIVSQKISSLQQKIQSLTNYQFQQQTLLKLIMKNLQNLDFSETQLNILQAQHKRIDFLQKELKKNEIYTESLIVQFQNEKNKIIKKYDQINTISERSSLFLADKKLETRVQRLTEQLEEVGSQKQQIIQQSKIEILKMQQRLNQILKENAILGKRNQILEFNYQKLQQFCQDLQTRQQQMDKILQEQRNLIMNDDITAEIINTITLHKNQQEINLMNEKIKQLSSINEQLNENKMQLSLQLNKIKNEIEQKNRQIDQLKDQVQAAQQKLNSFQQEYVGLDEYMDIKNAFLQVKLQLQQKNEILRNFKDILRIDVNGEQLTISQLLTQYSLKVKKVSDLQVARTNQQMKQIQLMGNLQLEKCRYNQFMKFYNNKMSQQGKAIIQKDIQIEQLHMEIKRLQEQIQTKQWQLEIQSQKLNNNQKNEQQVNQICNNYFRLEGQYNKLKEQNENLKNKLQKIEKQQNQIRNNLEVTNRSLVETNQKLNKKYEIVKNQLVKFRQWAKNQLDQYQNSITAKNYNIKKLQKQNQSLSAQIQKYKQTHGPQRDEFKKMMQENYIKQKRINELQERLKEMIMQQQEEAKIMREYKTKMQELSEELFRMRCIHQEQRRLHLQETTQLRSRNINKKIQQTREKVALLLKKGEKSKISSINFEQIQ